MITYNQSGMKGIGFKLGNYSILAYWYRPKNRPYIAVKNEVTNSYWRI